MSGFSDSIAIVWPSNWPMADEEAHCTIMFLGNISNVSFTKIDLWNAISTIKWPLMSVRTAGIEMFGPKADIPVVRLDSVILHTFHDKLEATLKAEGIESASEFKEYKPHITVKNYEEDMLIPDIVHLGSPEVWWGDER